jgi:hypothetical protein
MPRARNAHRGDPHPSPLLTDNQLALARSLCESADETRDPFAAEWFVSELLGMFWERRNAARALDRNDAEVAYEMARASLVQSIAAIGGRGAWIMLEIIRRLDRSEIRTVAGIRADALPAHEAPEWLDCVGAAGVVEARAAALRGDGEGIFLAVRGDGVPPHTVAFYIDDLSGGIAKRLALLQPLDYDVTPEPWDHYGEDVKLRTVDPVLACHRARAAMERTDAMTRAPVGECYAELRALVLSRITPPLAVPQQRPGRRAAAPRRTPPMRHD